MKMLKIQKVKKSISYLAVFFNFQLSNHLLSVVLAFVFLTYKLYKSSFLIKITAPQLKVVILLIILKKKKKFFLKFD